jgi:uncharacterized protein (TIGR03086 family)
MDAISLLPVAADEYGRRVHAVAQESWHAPTPCTEWSVHDVVNHVVGEQLWIAPLLEGRTIAEIGDRYDGDLLGDDPIKAWDVAVETALAAWAATPPSQTVHLSFGDVPTSEYADQMLLDLVVHGWDLSRGADLNDRLDPRTVEHALGYARKHEAEFAASGLFAPSVNIPSTDPQDQLVAMLGRRP